MYVGDKTNHHDDGNTYNFDLGRWLVRVNVVPEAEIYHTMHPANPPPHAFAGLRRGLALAWPHHTGHAFAEIVAWCGSNHLPCELASQVLPCTRTFLVDDRGTFQTYTPGNMYGWVGWGVDVGWGVVFSMFGMDEIN